MSTNFQELANFIWSVADLLRGPYRPPQYERVMLPMTVLRRFDCVLELTKDDVLNHYQRVKHGSNKMVDSVLNGLAKGPDGQSLGFHNHSELNFQRLKGDPDNIARHLNSYIDGFSENVRKIFNYFEFEKEIEKLDDANRLYQIVAKFADIDLHPKRVSNLNMGSIFEDLIRRFNEAANETAGDHFTPREVIRLMVDLLLEPDTHILTTPGIIVTICDPACGTGGMLSESENWIREHNPEALVRVYGQDYNPRSYAVADSDLLIKGKSGGQIELGNTLIDDKFPDRRFNYLLANPPFGVDWKAEQDAITREHEKLGFRGRFGPKLPRVNDGALLFLLHMISKFEPVNPTEKQFGSRIAIVFNGSPLFTGGAGSGESEIRRWIIERDWLEAIVALPESMFYNTGIGTYVWIVTNRKAADRKGKIQLIDVRDRWAPMRRSLGDKRRYLTDEIIEEVTREHGAFQPAATCKIFDNEYFGYRRVIIERPLRLRFQVTYEAKERFLDVRPEFLDAVLAIEEELGSEPYEDWNAAWEKIQRITREMDIRWTAADKKIFRQVFTEIDPAAKPVIAKHAAFLLPASIGKRQAGMSEAEFAALFGIYTEPRGKAVEYESDPALRDFENIPLQDDTVSFFLREVRPFVEDAWIDRESKDEKDGNIGKVGYEINFNREFFQYQSPRPLEEIDAELREVEKRIMGLLQEVTE